MRFETFAFLPPMGPSQIEAQVAHALSHGWVPMIEFTENPNSADFYWRQWPIVATKVNTTTGKAEDASAAQITSQLDSCARRNPYAFIRFSAYNPATRQTAISFVAKTPQEGQ